VSVDLLVTGANGQLGWELIRRAPAQALSLHGCTHAVLDITDQSAVAEAIARQAPRVVVNAAAYTAVDKAESEAALAFAVNRDGPRNLAEACHAREIPLIHISTDYVFSGVKAGAYGENDPVEPLGVYGASKLAGEQAIRETGVAHVVLRTAWVFGVHGANFVKTMLRLGQERDVLRVVDDQRGCPTFAGDLAEVVLTIARRLLVAPEPSLGLFHCVGSGETTWCGFAREIFTLARPRLARVPRIDAITTAEYPTPARRPANSVLDTAKLARTFGITLRPWQAGLEEMLEATLPAGTR
jgi:dTDP-4-dehydrorhamnose reductase